MIDRRKVARAFGAASHRYEAAARLQKITREELLGRLAHFALAPRVVIDLGAGTGASTAALARQFPRAQIIAIDLAEPMLVEAGKKLAWRDRLFGGRFGHPFARVAADASALPLPTGSVDLVFSNCMLQWCDDLDATLAEIRRVCAPDALFIASTFGPTTLQELRAAFARIDERPHVHDFVDMLDLGAALTRAGFEEPVLDVDRHRERHADLRAVMRSIKEIGAGNAADDRARGLFGKARWRALEAAYESFRDADGSLPVTWEVIHASCFADRRASSLPGAASESVVPFKEIGRRRQRGAS